MTGAATRCKARFKAWYTAGCTRAVVGAVAATCVLAAAVAPAREVSATSEPTRSLQTSVLEAEDASVSAAGSFHPVAPHRIVDTRAAGAPVTAATPFDIAAAGAGDVPSSGVEAVVLNVTVTQPSQASYVTVFPTGTQPPVASNVNFVAGETVANAVIAKVGPDGRVAVRLGHGTAHLVVDVQGWFGAGPEGATHRGVEPARLLDTREAGGPVIGTVSGGTPITVPIAGRAGVPPAGAVAAVLNVTVTEPSQASFLTVSPAGTAPPHASNLNFVAGETVANGVIAKLGADGAIALTVGHGRAHVVVDVLGWFGAPATGDPGATYRPQAPQRVLDTRTSSGAVAGGTSIAVDVSEAGAPENASAVVLNVTATQPSRPSYVTMYPTGSQRPTASNLNFTAGQTVANIVIAKVGADGNVSVFLGHGTAHVVVDVLGWFAATGSNPDDPAQHVPPISVDEVAAGGGWRFVPNSALLRPGESTVLDLVATDASGRPITAGLPPGTDVQSADAGVSVEYLGSWQVRVTAGAEVTSALVTAAIPGLPLKPSASITVAKLHPGVLALADTQIAFPPPNLPANLDLAAADLAAVGITEIGPAGAGPFSWTEVQQRTNLPDNALVDALANPADVLALDAWYPVVIRGAAPAPGTRVVGTGGSGISGTVFEPAGLPTLQRGDYALMVVKLGPLTDVFAAVDFAFDWSEFVAAGAAPATFAGGVDVMPVLTQDDDADTGTVAGPSGPQSGGEVKEPKECVDGLDNKWDPGNGYAWQPFSQVSITPIFVVRVDVGEEGLNGMRVELGGQLSVTGQAVMSAQLAITLKLSCVLAEMLPLSIPAPLPLAPFLTAKITEQLGFGVDIGIAGGPRLDVGIKCSVVAVAKLGFAYTPTDGVSNLSDASVPTRQCDPVWKPTAGVADDAAPAIKISAKVSLPITTTFSAQIGGNVAGATSAFVRRFLGTSVPDGTLDLVGVSAGPALNAAWETGTSVYQSEAASSGINGTLGASVSLKVAPVVWMLKFFGVGQERAAQSVGKFSPTLFQLTLKMFDLLAPLNYSSATATGGRGGAVDVPVLPALYVHQGDRFELRAVTAPAAGVGNLTFGLTSAKLYAEALGVAHPDDRFAVDVIQSTGAAAAYGRSTIRVKATIDDSLCAQLHAPYHVKLIGFTEFRVFGVTLSIPAWGGKYTIQCIEGSSRWDPTVLTELELGGGDQHAKVLTSDRRDSRWALSGKPVEYDPHQWLPGVPGWLSQIPTWLSVTADEGGGTTGTVAASPPLAEGETAEETELGFTFRVVEPGASGGHCWEPREAPIYFASEYRGVALVTVKEKDPCTFELLDRSITGPGIKTVRLSTRGLSADTLTLHSPEEWVTFVGAAEEGTLELPISRTDQTVSFQVRIEPRARSCEQQPTRGLTVDLTSQFRGTESFSVVDPEVEPWPDCGARFDPDYREISNGATGTSTLRFRGDVEDGGQAEWTISGGPAWLSVTPQSGTIDNQGSAGVSFSAMPIEPDCEKTIPSRIGTFTATVTWTTTTGSGDLVEFHEHSETATMTVKRMPIAPSGDCPPPPDTNDGGANGDPHMISMDGERWEGQTLGEYIYLRSVDAAEPWEVVARHEPTGGGATPRQPTSVYGAAVTFRGHRVEVLGGGVGPTVYVDGEQVTLDDDVPEQIADGFSVVRTGLVVRVDLPEVSANLRWYSLMDITVSAVVGVPMEGMLGSADDDPSNDFVGSDGTGYTAAQIHAGLSAYGAFVASWRITDPAESRFTVPSEHFASPNPGFDPEIVALEDDALAALSGYQEICGGELSERQLYGLALELHVGTPPDRLEQYVCRYAVEGFALTEGAPTAGLRVRVDAPGLAPCSTTTGIDGRYRCELLVDLDEVRAWDTGATFGLAADVSATWPGQPGSPTAAAGTASFAALAPLGAGPLAGRVDLAIDPDSVPRLELSGLIYRDGAPLPGPQYIWATAFDADGAQVLATALPVVAAADGRFDALRVLPPSATRVELSVTVDDAAGPAETFLSSRTGLVPGLNLHAFDVVYTVPTVRVHGTLTDGVAPIGGTHLVTLALRDGSGATLPPVARFVTADPSTGAYDLTVRLPRDARSAAVSIRLAPHNETFAAAPVAIPLPAAADVVLDVVLPRPYVTVAGTLADASGAPLGPVLLAVTFYDGSAWLGQSTVYVSGGSFSQRFTAPAAADAARAQVVAGVPGETFDSAIVAIAAGENTIALDVALTPVLLTVSGYLHDAAGEPLPGSIPVSAVFRDSGGVTLSSGQQHVSADSDTGFYAVTFVGHRNATQADVTVLVDGNAFAAHAADLARGDNSVTRDVGYNPPVVALTGRATGAGGAALVAPPGQLRIQVSRYRADGSSSSVNAFVVLAADGAYSTELVLPLDVVAVEAVIGLSSPTLPGVDRFFTGRIAVEPGRNPMTFDAAYDPPVVTVTGHMVSAPGQGLAPPYVTVPLDLGVSGYRINGDGAREQVSYAQPKITPAADGSYTATVTLSRHATEVEALAYVGPQPRQVFTGIQPGSGPANTLTFDVQYWPAVVHVAGTAHVDGAVPSNVYVQVHRSGVQIYGNTLAVNAATGAFERSLVLPLGLAADDLDVTVTPTAGAAHVLRADDVSDGDTRALDFGAIADTSTRVALSGVANMFGAPADALYVVAHPQLGDGSPAGFQVGRGASIDPGTGEYVADFKLPPGTERVIMVAFASADGYTVNRSIVTAVTPQQENTVQLSLDSFLLEMSGSVTRGGSRAGDPDDEPELRFVVNHGTPDDRHGEVRDVYYEWDNTFSFAHTIAIDPAVGVAPGVAVELDAIGSEQFGATFAFPLGDLEPGRYQREWHLDIGAGVPLRLTGHLHLDDDTETTTFTVDQYRYDPDDWTAGYELLGTVSFDEVDQYGPEVEFDLDRTVTVDPSTNLIRVTIDDRWTRTFDVDAEELADPEQPIEIEWNLDTTAGPKLSIGGDVKAYPCSSPLPQVFAREYWAFTSASDAEVSLDEYVSGASWGNGVLVDRHLIVPELESNGHGTDDDGSFDRYAYTSQVILPAHDGPLWVRIVNDVRGSHYSAFYGASVIDPETDNGWGGWDLEQEAACYG